MDATADFTSIVVVGHMNPRIHHPYWYTHIGQLTNREADNVLASVPVISTPLLASFATPEFAVECQPRRWEAKTTDPQLRPRLLTLAVETFRALDHTPVETFGFNFNFERDVGCDIARWLTGRLQAAGLGLPSEPGSAFVQRVLLAEQKRVTVTLQPGSRGKGIVYVGVNHHFDIQALVPGELHFDLGRLLEHHWSAAASESEATLAAIEHAIRG